VENSALLVQVERLDLRFTSSGRFTRHGWRLHVYINLLGLAAAMADKLAAEEKESGGNDDQERSQI
jgi:hypothetical protein